MSSLNRIIVHLYFVSSTDPSLVFDNIWPTPPPSRHDTKIYVGSNAQNTLFNEHNFGENLFDFWSTSTYFLGKHIRIYRTTKLYYYEHFKLRVNSQMFCIHWSFVFEFTLNLRVFFDKYFNRETNISVPEKYITYFWSTILDKDNNKSATLINHCQLERRNMANLSIFNIKHQLSEFNNGVISHKHYMLKK